ncbi:MAG: hypothetical protein ACXWZK_03050 [Solirubrobacterales bacterium]
MRLALATACLAIAAVAVISLIQGEEEEGASVRVAPPPETADPLPELPRGWSAETNAAGGFALGVPPGWSAKSAGEQTTLRSPGSSVVARVTADRTEAAVNAGLDEYAEGLLEELGGPDEAEAETMSAPAGYERSTASGEGPGGRRLDVFVVRRPELAAFPILVASDRAVKRAKLDPIVAELVGSLRGRPAISS